MTALLITLAALAAGYGLGRWRPGERVLAWAEDQRPGTVRFWLAQPVLAAALADCKAAAVVSGYHSELYDELYAGWHRYEKSVITSNATGDLGRIEVLWSNRQLAGQGALDFGETS